MDILPLAMLAVVDQEKRNEAFRKIAASSQRRLGKKTAEQASRIETLEELVGELRLMVAAMLNLLLENKTIPPEQLSEILSRLDMLDGSTDGKLDSSVSLAGEKREEKPTPDPLTELIDATKETQ